MKIGTTSFSFRTLLREQERAPSLMVLVDMCKELGLERLQVCENARPLNLSSLEWNSLVEWAATRGVEIQLGCKTLSPDILNKHLDRAEALPSRMLRVVVEEDHSRAPSREFIRSFIDSVLPRLERKKVCLAFENHFDVSSKMLSEIVSQYSSPLLGFCIDSANSLRSFEPPSYVLDQLLPRAFCFHVKDYKVVGDHLGFSVKGAPLGQGKLDLDQFLDAAFSTSDEPQLFIENWVTSVGSRERDIEEDHVWLAESVRTLKERLKMRAGVANQYRSMPL
jgi:3-oxoisoapionate decarboxylase